MTSFSLVDQDFFNAALNWLRWKDDYECLQTTPLPILSDKERFKSFCSEYSVLRYENPLTKDLLRADLERNLSILAEATSVEDMAFGWKKLHGLKKIHVSFATKILAFSDPNKFSPMDRFSKAGLKQLDCNGEISSYSVYLLRFFEIKKKYYPSICVLRDRYSGFKPANMDAFENRILDCALMRIGAR